jgi:hypothetical protein
MERVADNLSKAGWSWGCVSAVDSQGRTICIVDAHRDDGKRFVLRADEKLTAFLELERVMRRSNVFNLQGHRTTNRQQLSLFFDHPYLMADGVGVGMFATYIANFAAKSSEVDMRTTLSLSPSMNPAVAASTLTYSLSSADGV